MTRSGAAIAALLLRRHAPLLSPCSALLALPADRARFSSPPGALAAAAPSFSSLRSLHRPLTVMAAAASPSSSSAPSSASAASGEAFTAVAAGLSPSFFTTREEAEAAAAQAARASLSPSSRPPLVQCGDLACQHDSFRRTLELDGSSHLLGFAVYEDRPAAGGGKGKKKKGGKKKGKGPPATAGGGDGAAESSPLRCAVVLSDSVFFPEGGGQPADRGRIVLRLVEDGGGAGSEGGGATEETIELSVLDGRNLDGTCVLTCRPSGPSEGVGRDDLAAALLGGDRAVKSIAQEIDWPLRFDHMTQHSAQHLLSAIAASDQFGNLYTESFSLGRGEAALTSYIDFKVGEDLYANDVEESRSLLRRVEDRANDCIRRNLPMTPQYIDPDSDEFAEKVRSRVLPEGLTGPLRLVEIGDGIDLNTCCGTHVPSLAHLQAVQLFRVEKVKGGVVRAHFAAADRLRRCTAEMYERQSRFTTMLSCREEEHVERVRRMLDEKVEKEREMRGMKEKMCALQAKEVARECREAGGSAAIDVGGGFDMAYMIQLSSAVTERCQSDEGGGDGPAVLTLFVSNVEEDGGQASGAKVEEGTFLLTGDAGMVDRLGKKVAESLGGRGGGKNGRFQGKGTKVRSGLEEARRLLGEEMKLSRRNGDSSTS